MRRPRCVREARDGRFAAAARRQSAVLMFRALETLILSLDQLSTVYAGPGQAREAHLRSVAAGLEQAREAHRLAVLSGWGEVRP